MHMYIFFKKNFFSDVKIVGFRGWRQDCGLGGCGIHILAQPGHLPGTSGAPWTPKGMEGTPSNWVGRELWGGSERGGKVKAGRDWW